MNQESTIRENSRIVPTLVGCVNLIAGYLFPVLGNQNGSSPTTATVISRNARARMIQKIEVPISKLIHCVLMLSTLEQVQGKRNHGDKTTIKKKINKE